MNKNLSKCSIILKKGGIAIFPTDTAFGIGCRLDSVKAVRKLFSIRKRPKNKPVLVLASSRRMVKRYIQDLPQEAKELIKKNWPGGLTIVFNANKQEVPELVRGGGNTIGIRIPAHSTIRELVREVGVPILAPSANFAGDKTPFRLNEVDKKLITLVDFVMPGKCKIKEQSTVVDVTRDKLKVIRAGAVKI